VYSCPAGTFLNPSVNREEKKSEKPQFDHLTESKFMFRISVADESKTTFLCCECIKGHGTYFWYYFRDKRHLQSKEINAKETHITLQLVF